MINIYNVSTDYVLYITKPKLHSPAFAVFKKESWLFSQRKFNLAKLRVRDSFEDDW